VLAVHYHIIEDVDGDVFRLGGFIIILLLLHEEVLKHSWVYTLRASPVVVIKDLDGHQGRILVQVFNIVVHILDVGLS